MEYDTKGRVLKKAVVWKELYSYRKSDAIYQLTVEFCQRFLPAHGDRTVDQMVQDEDGRWKCGPDFKTDKTDVKLAILIAKAQLAFQELFFMPIAEKYYDDREVEKSSRVRHQKKTRLAYSRLPNPCTASDVDREYGYNGVKGSICSCLKRLQDDGLLQKIRSGKDKGKFRKLA